MLRHAFQSAVVLMRKIAGGNKVKQCQIAYRNLKIVICLVFLIAIGSIYKYKPLNLENDGSSLAEIAENWLPNNDKILMTELKPQQPYSPAEILNFLHNISVGLDILLNFRQEVDCQILFNPTHSSYDKVFVNAAKWKLEESEEHIWQKLSESPNICEALNQYYFFFSRPLSVEEAAFPLAYGMLIHSDIREMIYLIASFYHPQNAYCIAIDGKANPLFQQQIKVFQQCFPNIHIYVTRQVDYGGYQIPVVVLSCLQKLADRKHPWKYFQYLSNVDLPLKTNLEMVRIFKALNGTFNAEVEKLTSDRHPFFLFNFNRKSTLPLWKSSLSATFSRKAANMIANDPRIYNLLLDLAKGNVPDETMWVTIAGNPENLQIPGGFSAADFYTKISSDLSTRNFSTFQSTDNRFPLKSYYISRYQIWSGKNNRLKTEKKCHGSYVSLSCVFGIGDLATLNKRPELVAHKFYMNIQPAAFFCLYENVRLRALNQSDQQSFDATYYSQLPQIQLSRGKSINDIQFFF